MKKKMDELWKGLRKAIQNREPAENEDIRLMVALLCWGAVLLSLPQLALYIRISYGVMNWLNYILTLCALGLVGAEAYLMRHRHAEWMLPAALAAYALALILDCVGMTRSIFGWDMSTLKTLATLIAVSLCIADLCMDGRMRIAVRWAWLICIALELFDALIALPLSGGNKAFAPVLTTLMGYAAMLLYWLYLPVQKLEISGVSARFRRRKQPEHRQDAPVPNVPELWSEGPSAYEERLVEIKRKLDAGEMTQEEYERQREKIVELM